MKFHSPLAACILVFVCANAILGLDLQPAEILTRHLDSIAVQTKRRELKTLFAGGLSEFEARLPLVKGGGKVVVISDPENLYFLMSLNSRDYPFEKIGAFRSSASIPFISPGHRSLLGSFLNDNPQILTEGLFCGSMSLRWINHITDGARLKMKSAGMKKIDGRQTYAIDVFISGIDSGKFTVRLFFDSENFRHVRSEYHRTVEIGSITFRQQNQLADARADLTEEFSDFRKVDGFTFPYQYKVTFATNSSAQTYENSWGIRVSDYYLNQKLEPDFFTFDIK